MKITCNAGDMKKALSIAMSAMAARPAQTALGCVLMDAVEGAVALYATDGSMEISVRMDAAVKEEGTALLPGKLLLEYVSIASGEITLSVDEKQRCVISGAGRKSTIAGIPPEEYVICTLPDTEPTVFMAGETFARLVKGCAFCAGVDEARKTLVSVYAAFGPDKAEFVSLDGYRMVLVHGDCRAQAPLRRVYRLWETGRAQRCGRNHAFGQVPAASSKERQCGRPVPAKGKRHPGNGG